LRDTNYFEEKIANSLLTDCEEILKIVGSIIKTMKQKFLIPNSMTPNFYGNKEIWNVERIALFCSQKCPATVRI